MTTVYSSIYFAQRSISDALLRKDSRTIILAAQLLTGDDASCPQRQTSRDTMGGGSSTQMGGGEISCCWWWRGPVVFQHLQHARKEANPCTSVSSGGSCSHDSVTATCIFVLSILADQLPQVCSPLENEGLRVCHARVLPPEFGSCCFR